MAITSAAGYRVSGRVCNSCSFAQNGESASCVKRCSASEQLVARVRFCRLTITRMPQLTEREVSFQSVFSAQDIRYKFGITVGRLMGDGWNGRVLNQRFLVGGVSSFSFNQTDDVFRCVSERKTRSCYLDIFILPIDQLKRAIRGEHRSMFVKIRFESSAFGNRWWSTDYHVRDSHRSRFRRSFSSRPRDATRARIRVALGPRGCYVYAIRFCMLRARGPQSLITEPCTRLVT